MTESTRGVRAQAGVGTVILLVAALLVAATTIGVFFEVAGTVEDDTAAAGSNAAEEFTGQLEVLAASGTVDDGTIEVVNLTVKQGTDSGTTDLRTATVQWIGPNGAETLTNAGTADDGPDFGITTVVDEDGSGPVLSSDTDRAILTIDPGTGINATTTVDGRTVDIDETGPALEPGDRVTIDIVTDGETRYPISVPLELDRSTVEL